MNQVFWVGVYPGLSDAHKDYMLSVLHEYVASKTNTVSLNPRMQTPYR